MTSFFADDLCRWLRDPVVHVRVTPSDEVQQLRAEIESLQSTIDDLHMELTRIQTLYTRECDLNMRLQDIFRANGLKWR